MTIQKFTKHIIAAAFMILPLFSVAQQGGQKHFKLLKGERWYGGTVDEGNLAPYEPGYKFDLSGIITVTSQRRFWFLLPEGTSGATSLLNSCFRKMSC